MRYSRVFDAEAIRGGNLEDHGEDAWNAVDHDTVVCVCVLV